MWSVKRTVVLLVVFLSVATVFSTHVSADRFSSTNYVIDASVMNTAGGSSGSSSYKLVGSSGETIIGNGASGSYKMGAGFVSQLENSLQLTVQPSGLVGYFALDEATGLQAYDASASYGYANAVGTPPHTAGKLGGALGPFTASNYMEVPTQTPYNVSAITVCSWVNMTATSTNPTAVSRSIGTPNVSGMWGLGFNTGSTPVAYLYAGGTTNTLTSTLGAIGTGSWKHVCFSYGGTNMALYVDGVAAGTLAVNQALANPGVPLRIGARAAGANPFNGLVDEVKVYSRVLTAEEVKAEYAGQNAGSASGIFAGTVISGFSTTATYDAIVRTDTSNYNLAVNQNQNLTSGGNSIPAVSGTIASPASWVEGTTKGLGFTLYGTNATAIAGKWSSGAAYAAFPGSATTIYTRTGLGGSTPDVLNMRLRLDTSSSQPSGDYTNVITVTGTITP